MEQAVHNRVRERTDQLVEVGLHPAEDFLVAATYDDGVGSGIGPK